MRLTVIYPRLHSHRVDFWVEFQITQLLLLFYFRALEAFHMKCQRQLLQIKWHQFIRNDEIATTGLLSCISETVGLVATRAFFGHVARVPDDVARGSQGTQLPSQPISRLCRPPSSQWHRHPGRPGNRWVDKIWSDNNLPPVDLWRRAVSRGHRRYGPVS